MPGSPNCWGIFHKKCHVSSHESIPSTFIAATRAPRVQLTVKHVVKLPNQVYKNQKRATLTTHGHRFRQPKSPAVRMFHPYWLFCYRLILTIKLAGFVHSFIISTTAPCSLQPSQACSHRISMVCHGRDDFLPRSVTGDVWRHTFELPNI